MKIMANRITAIGNEWASLRAKPSRTAEEDEHLAELSAQLKQANQEWNQFLNRLYADLGKTKQAQQDVASLQENASGMQSILRQLGTGAVALYTLVGEDKYRVILVTSSVMQAREYPITPPICVRRSSISGRRSMIRDRIRCRWRRSLSHSGRPGGG